MKKETRTVVYDDELRIEAYRFEGIVQPFPNHFHESVYRVMMAHWITGDLTLPKKSCWTWQKK